MGEIPQGDYLRGGKLGGGQTFPFGPSRTVTGIFRPLRPLADRPADATCQ